MKVDSRMMMTQSQELPQLFNLTESGLESYLYHSNTTEKEYSKPVSPKKMAKRLVTFLKTNKEKINQEQLKLVTIIAQRAQLIGNNDVKKDFKKLVKRINKLEIKLGSPTPSTKEAKLGNATLSAKEVKLGNPTLSAKPSLSIGELERNKPIYTSHITWKVGALFAAMMITGIGYTMLAQKNIEPL